MKSSMPLIKWVKDIEGNLSCMVAGPSNHVGKEILTVTVMLRGGLGNQLFQYAAGYALAERTNSNLVLDASLLPATKIRRNGVSSWPEQISSFAHAGSLIFPPKTNAVRSRIRQSLAGFERKLGDSNLYGFRRRAVFAYEQRESIDKFIHLAPNCRINAYCNSPSFFSGYEQQLKDHVSNLVAPSDWFIRQREMVEREKPLFLHVRWGDYLNLKHIYGEVSSSYYVNAVGLLTNISKEQRPIWLSSDDPIGAAEFLRSHLKIDRVLEAPELSAPLETVLLMGSGSGLVAANSSFSWWSAFTGGNQEEFEVVFPRPLFGPHGPQEPKNWLLSGWLQLGRN